MAHESEQRADVALAKGDYADAILILEDLCRQQSSKSGALSASRAHDLNQLSLAYLAAGRNREALAAERQALDCLHHLHGPMHPDSLAALDQIAATYHRLGELGQAERLYTESLKIQDAMPSRRLESAQTLARLAWLHSATGRTADALDAMRAAEAHRDRYIFDVISVGSEPTQGFSLGRVQNAYHWFLALGLQYFSHCPETAELLFGFVQHRKLLGLHCSLIRRLSTWSSLDGEGPHLPPGYVRLKQDFISLSRAARSGAAAPMQRAHDDAIELGLMEARLSADLSQRAQSAAPTAEPFSLKRLAESLPPAGVLIEFVKFQDHDFSNTAGGLPEAGSRLCYMAFVLNGQGSLTMHHLGDATRTDTLVDHYRGSIVADRAAVSRGLLFEEQEEGGTFTAGHRVRELLIDPLLEAIGPSDRWIIATDGELARLPIEALPWHERKGYLIDRCRICYVDIARDYGRLPKGDLRRRTDPVVVADPQFSLLPGKKGIRQWFRSWVNNWRNPNDGSKRVGFPRSQFQPLPGTRVEGRYVAAKLGAQLWNGAQALASSVKQLRSPSVLHIATHGYFLAAAPTLSDSESSRDWAPPPDDPMERSGLVLAGANRIAEAAISGSGVLTAAEIATMALQQTQLVVLSACDTGLGETAHGHGVIGLRRAFTLAGACSLIMSLWKIDDQATALLMMRFYENWIDRRETIGDALHNARQWLRELSRDEVAEYWQRLQSTATAQPGIDSVPVPADAVSHCTVEKVIPAANAGFDAVVVTAKRIKEPDCNGLASNRPFAHPYYWGAFVLIQHGAD